MNFYYVNTKNERVNFYENPYIMTGTDLLDWKYTKRDSSITAFYREATDYSMTVAILIDDYASYDELTQGYKEAANKLVDILDYDNANDVDGKLYTDTGFYMSCRIIASKKTTVQYKSGTPYQIQELTVHSEDPVWVRETKYIFDSKKDSTYQELNYPYNYDFNLGLGAFAKTYERETSIPTDFRLEIKGECQTPRLTINGNVYEVDVHVDYNATLIISTFESATEEKQIYIKYTDGTIINALNYRNKDYNIFKKIEGSKITIETDSNIVFNLILIEKRSEPLWK